MNITDIFISLLCSQITGEGERVPVSEIDCDVMAELFRLADIHDVSQTLFWALVECGALGEDHELYSKFIDAEEISYFRLKRIEHSFADITEAFAEAGIEYVPLKGSVIREYYPSPLMRMSADIDIMVNESDLDRAVRVLLARPGYRVTSKKSFHDISLYTPDEMHLELHFNIMENDAELDHVLSRVWDYAVPVSHKKCEFALVPEFFAFHIVTHMVYHFVNGGCGVKPFSDLFVFKKNVGYSEEKVRSLCRDCGIEEFYLNAVNLTNAWFGEGEHTDITRRMEAHIIHNAVCGDIEKGVAIRQVERGGRGSYLLGRIFLPYSQLKIRYRTLEKWPILFPVFEVVRWLEFVFGNKERAKRELEMTKNMTPERMAEIKEFYESVGLPRK